MLEMLPPHCMFCGKPMTPKQLQPREPSSSYTYYSWVCLENHVLGEDVMIDLSNKNTGASFGFGLNPQQLIEQLTDLIDGLNTGEILPQEISRSVSNAHNDFETHTLTFKYVEKKDD